MTSKSASAAFADGAAFISRSRAACAALPAAENPRILAAAASCADAAADSHTVAAAAAHSVVTPTHTRVLNFIGDVIAIKGRGLVLIPDVPVDALAQPHPHSVTLKYADGTSRKVVAIFILPMIDPPPLCANMQ